MRWVVVVMEWSVEETMWTGNVYRKGERSLQSLPRLRQGQRCFSGKMFSANRFRDRVDRGNLNGGRTRVRRHRSLAGKDLLR